MFAWFKKLFTKPLPPPNMLSVTFFQDGGVVSLQSHTLYSDWERPWVHIPVDMIRLIEPVKVHIVGGRLKYYHFKVYLDGLVKPIAVQAPPSSQPEEWQQYEQALTMARDRLEELFLQHYRNRGKK